MYPSKRFFVEVKVYLEKGVTIQDWEHVDTIYGQISGDDVDKNCFTIMRQVVAGIGRWVKKNPDAHDCITNSAGRSGNFICQKCGDNTTKDMMRRLNILAGGEDV